MKSLFVLLLLSAFSAHASPVFSVKERLRLHLWSFGLEERPVVKKVHVKPQVEEIERPLRKI